MTLHVEYGWHPAIFWQVLQDEGQAWNGHHCPSALLWKPLLEKQKSKGRVRSAYRKDRKLSLNADEVIIY